MITSGIGFLGQINNQIGNLNNQNTQVNTLEEQISTGEQSQTLAGYNNTTEVDTILNAHTTNNQLTGYNANIQTATQNITLMNQSMSSIATEVQQLQSSIQLFNDGGQTNLGNIQQLGQQGLNFIENLLNQTSNNQYIFAGSNATAQPFDSDSTLQGNIQTQVTNWLNGSQTTAQMMTNVQNLTGQQLGLDPSLSSAGDVTVNVNPQTNIDYTVKADAPYFQSVLQAFALAANLVNPSSGDAPTNADLNSALNQLGSILGTAAQGLNQAQTTLGSQLTEMQNIQSQNTQDSQTLTALLQNDENANTTAAVAQMNSLQTQLQASYDVTSSVSKLSLLNFLNSVTV